MCGVISAPGPGAGMHQRGTSEMVLKCTCKGPLAGFGWTSAVLHTDPSKAVTSQVTPMQCHQGMVLTCSLSSPDPVFVSSTLWHLLVSHLSRIQSLVVHHQEALFSSSVCRANPCILLQALHQRGVAIMNTVCRVHDLSMSSSVSCSG